MPSDAHLGQRYDSQILHDIPPVSITNGRPKVLFVSREGEVPSNGEEVAHILLNTFDPDACIKNLRHTAYERNAEVSAVLSHENTPWRYMVDWYTDCKGVEQSEELPVERIIQANR
ncbi:Scytalone dehydratase arp1 [Fusarium oxysporum f. sp. albedinis]|nr:Scytalone dehydratase arp1 [Fusarium oxysporum f. sp. albedinis]